MTADRELSFCELLSELQGFVGEPVVIESLSRRGHCFHESRGVLERSVDLQVDFGRSLDRPAHITFCVNGGAFTLREREVVGGRTSSMPADDAGQERLVQIEFAGGGELLVREDWERDYVSRLVIDEDLL